MALDTDKIDDTALALLYLTLHDGCRAWKGFGGALIPAGGAKCLIEDIGHLYGRLPLEAHPRYP